MTIGLVRASSKTTSSKSVLIQAEIMEQVLKQTCPNRSLAYGTSSLARELDAIRRQVFHLQTSTTQDFVSNCLPAFLKPEFGCCWGAKKKNKSGDRRGFQKWQGTFWGFRWLSIFHSCSWRASCRSRWEEWRPRWRPRNSRAGMMQ